jgi:hypothetical protein
MRSASSPLAMTWLLVTNKFREIRKPLPTGWPVRWITRATADAASCPTARKEMGR